MRREEVNKFVNNLLSPIYGYNHVVFLTNKNKQVCLIILSTRNFYQLVILNSLYRITIQ